MTSRLVCPLFFKNFFLQAYCDLRYIVFCAPGTPSRLHLRKKVVYA